MKRDAVEAALTKMRAENPGLIVQAFRASRAPNPAAVEMVAAQTVGASKSGSTLAAKPELDMLLRLAGTRQIGEAFERSGYKSAGKRLFLVAASDGMELLDRLKRTLATDRRYVEVRKRRLTKSDLELVERAALLAAGV